MKPCLIFLLLVLLILAACSPRQIIYSRAGATRSEFNRDKSECYMFARQIAASESAHIRNGISAGIIAGMSQNRAFTECMQIRGYSAEVQ